MQRMNMQRTTPIMLASVLTAALAACSSLQPPAGEPDRRAAQSGECRVEPVQWAVGEEASPTITGRIWRESHAGLLRPIAPGQAVRHDHRADRVNVDVDADNRITRIWCG